jgi:hypothetical protein
MILMPCPFLKEWVRLSAAREAHIRERHDDLRHSLHRRLEEVLADPSEIYWSDSDPSTLLFCRWYPDLLNGKYIRVVVVLDATGVDQPWIITAYVARRRPPGELAWRRN